MRSLEVEGCLNAPSAIGLARKSHHDIVSYPYPSRLRELDEGKESRAETPSQCLELQIENWEDEGGQIAKGKKSIRRDTNEHT